MGGPSRILVVDDEVNMRSTLADILHLEGYLVDTAGTGEEAVALCSSAIYELIMMDVRMPMLSGFEACRQIRRLGQGARVILMSAHEHDGFRERALGEGAMAFVSKPLDIPWLLRQLREMTG